MILTEEILQKGMSNNGALNLEQINLIVPQYERVNSGVWGLRKGWKKRLIGSEISLDKVKMFLLLKNKHLAHKIRREETEKAQLSLFSLCPETTKTSCTPSSLKISAKEP